MAPSVNKCATELSGLFSNIPNFCSELKSGRTELGQGRSVRLSLWPQSTSLTLSTLPKLSLSLSGPTTGRDGAEEWPPRSLP